MGSLAETPLPTLLVGLHRDAFDGRLTLHRGTVSKRFEWRAGAPVTVSSRLPAEKLCEILAADGALTLQTRTQVEQTVAVRRCSELQALASLGLTTPRTVVLALAEQLRRSLRDCLGWREGEFRLEPDAAVGSAPALPFDLLALVHEEIANGWAQHEILSALGPHALTHPTLVPGFETPWLEDAAARERLLARLDGSATTFALLSELDDPAATASVWVLDALGALVHRGEATAAAAATPEGATAEAEALPEIEIVVSQATATEAKPTEAPRERPERVAANAAADRLRGEVESPHARLSSLSRWAVLGLEPGADPRAVRRAYLKAAKRLHPDRILQLGLTDVKTQANEVFAEITHAHTVLTDPEQRRLYEESADAPATDADRIAEAEASFRRGDVLLRAGNFRGALELLERAVTLWPEEAEYHAALAWALHRKTPPESERAWEHFERALTLGEQAVWLLRASLVARELGNETRAGELAARARSLDPNVKA
ncbi:MAG: J domain-containing protein [Myxococcota bacterium]